ncbi:MAG: hypothetical protein FWD23_10935 [Oscillospiraceae bacterium]|nr:hypothetical protein [Oscillospiraceae bacterium]
MALPIDKKVPLPGGGSATVEQIAKALDVKPDNLTLKGPALLNGLEPNEVTILISKGLIDKNKLTPAQLTALPELKGKFC